MQCRRKTTESEALRWVGCYKGSKANLWRKVLSWQRKSNMEELLGMWRGREFQVVGAATAKLREPKHVQKSRALNETPSSVVNSLPSHVTAAPALSIFCCFLKSHLFSLSYSTFGLFPHLYSAHAVTHYFGHYNRYYFYHKMEDIFSKDYSKIWPVIDQQTHLSRVNSLVMDQ